MNPHPDTAARLTIGQYLSARVRVVPAVVATICVMAAFLNPIQPVTATRVSPTDPVLLLKLAVAGLAWVIGIWGFASSSQTRQLLCTLPGILLLALTTLFFISSLISPAESKLISFASALILMGYLLFVASSLTTIGLDSMVRGFLIGLTVYLGLAWLIYLLFPTFAEFHEYTDATTTVTRMGGLAHPNSIAREAAATLIVALAVFRHCTSGRDRSRKATLALLLIIGLVFVTMFATLSRTSVLAAGAGAAMLLFDKLYNRLGVVIALMGLIAILSAVWVSGVVSNDSVAASATSALTKSGELEELTSLTGRTQIWQEAIRLISQRPLTGYGLDSAASVMSKEAVGTHSLLLNVMFSGGVIAGWVMLGLLVINLWIAISSPQPLFRGLATYVLVSGLVEDTIFPSFPATFTLLWIAMLLWHVQASNATIRRTTESEVTLESIQDWTEGRRRVVIEFQSNRSRRRSRPLR